MGAPRIKDDVAMGDTNPKKQKKKPAPPKVAAPVAPVATKPIPKAAAAKKK